MATPLRLAIHLQPRAARSKIVGWHGTALKVQVHAPPVDGAANAELIALLAAVLQVPHRSLRIVRGATSRDKLVEIDCADVAACLARLPARVDKEKAGG